MVIEILKDNVAMRPNGLGDSQGRCLIDCKHHIGVSVAVDTNAILCGYDKKGGKR